MAMTINTNRSASIANRALTETTRAMDRSLAKLSSGQRVESARDDAASLAIGSRLRSEIASVKTYAQNAAQGSAMLQVADGAYGRAYDLLVRMKALATQASSSQLSATERGMLDTEFQQLKSEVNRLGRATTFNGQAIVGNTADLPNSLGYAQTEYDFTIFDSKTYDGDLFFDGNYFADNSGTLYEIENSSSPINDGNLNFYKILDFRTKQVVGQITMTNAIASDFTFLTGSFTINNSFQAQQKFTVGAGTGGQVGVGLYGLTTSNLGIALTGITTAARSDVTIEQLNVAMDNILYARASAGAAMNRLESAAASTASIVENLELARSAYMDLDVAAEMSKFVALQITQQAGISMLAEANRSQQIISKLLNN
jgi:flagellin